LAPSLSDAYGRLKVTEVIGEVANTNPFAEVGTPRESDEVAACRWL
jgi:hypothetical protein